MTTKDAQFDWKEMTQLIFGIIMVAAVQAAFRAGDDLDRFSGEWLIDGLFGFVYAMIGGGVYIAFTKRRRRLNP